MFKDIKKIKKYIILLQKANDNFHSSLMRFNFINLKKRKARQPFSDELLYERLLLF